MPGNLVELHIAYSLIARYILAGPAKEDSVLFDGITILPKSPGLFRLIESFLCKDAHTMSYQMRKMGW